MNTDDSVDALYLEMSEHEPEGVVEIAEGVNLDTAQDDKIVGIEILDASKKIDLSTIFANSLELDSNLINKKVT